MIFQLMVFLLGYWGDILGDRYIFSSKIIKHPLFKEYVFEEVYFYDGEKNEHILRLYSLTDYKDKKFHKMIYLINSKMILKYFTGKNDLLENIYCIPNDIYLFINNFGDVDGGAEIYSDINLKDSKNLTIGENNLGSIYVPNKVYESVRYKYTNGEKILIGGNICKHIKFSDDGADLIYSTKEYDLRYCDNLKANEDKYSRYYEIKLNRNVNIGDNLIKNKIDNYKRKISEEKEIISKFDCYNDIENNRINKIKVGGSKKQIDEIKKMIATQNLNNSVEKIRSLITDIYNIKNLDTKEIRRAQPGVKINIPTLIIFNTKEKSELSVLFNKDDVNYDILSKYYNVLFYDICKINPNSTKDSNKVILHLNSNYNYQNYFQDYAIPNCFNNIVKQEFIFIRIGNKSEYFNVDVFYDNRVFLGKNVEGIIKDVEGEVYFIDGDLVKYRIGDSNFCSRYLNRPFYIEQ